MAGTITQVKNKRGQVRYRNQLRLMIGGKTYNGGCRTFDNYKAAERWGDDRRDELLQPGALEKEAHKGTTIGQVLEWYLADYHEKRPFGRSKLEDVNSLIRRPEIASLNAMTVTAKDLIDYAGFRAQTVKPGTIQKDFMWTKMAFKKVELSRGIEFQVSVFEKAEGALKGARIIGTGGQRDRRPTLEDVKKIIMYFREHKKQLDIPMEDIILFSIFSTRRRKETCGIKWPDLCERRRGVTVRNMKHPKGNRDSFVLLPELAWRIIQKQVRPHPDEKDQRIFPFRGPTVSMHFRKACRALGIEDLHFHDLRHEGTSVYAEMGLTTSQLTAITGHLGLSCLERYIHIQGHGTFNKYEGFEYLP